MESGKATVMKKILFLTILSLLALSCRQNELQEEELDAKFSYTAEIEDMTKTYTDGSYNVLWYENDRIALFEQNTLADVYEVTDQTAGTGKAVFVYVESAADGFVSGMDLRHTVAYYPYSETVECQNGESEDTYVISAELPSTQSYTRGSVGLGSLPMVAVKTDSDSRNLKFYNVCGAVRIQLKGTAKVTSLVLNGHNNERLSGLDEITVHADGSMPEITMADDASKSVTLMCDNPVQLSPEAVTDFYIVVPPVKFKSGFTVTVNAESGTVYEFNTYEKNPVGRAEVLKMPEIIFENGSDPEVVPAISDPGIAYMWDESVIPEITIKITEEEWNKLLARYDEYNHNVDYFHADFTYKKGEEVTEITDGGLRLRGNTSRRRPEGSYGQQHDSENPDWHHCHFGINFRKFHKDSDHTIKGIRKVNLKWFKDDPNYVRELYCYDLFRRYGIWTAAHDVYCRLWLKVGDAEPAYFGVYEMIEPIDDEFIERRLPNMFENAKGNLWKCGGTADLNGLDGSWSIDLDNGINYDYEYKGDEEDYAAAKAQLQDFILKLQGKSDESFYKWIKEVCDVEFLLKTYAVNVVVGMCDDHWNNGNNFYIYFNTTDKYEYQFFFLPYDYDNTLGTSWNCGIISDTGRHDPYNWGDKGLLMERLMQFDEFRTIYRNALKELVAEENALFHVDASIARIKAWQDKIREYVTNATGEDMSIYDDAADWGDNQDYLLMTKGEKNFFEVKTATINAMQ